VKAFSFLLTLIVFIGMAVVLSITMSRHLRTQVEELRARL
jgi:sensor domain CHASE-containing protein